MKFLTAITFFSLSCCAAFAQETYRQNITVKFDSNDSANTATAAIKPLPNNKKIAFSTRWDDSNLRHLQTAQMLNRHGLKATCYLDRLEDPKILDMAKTIIKAGNAVGAHTLTHPFLDTLLPNDIFREIALERVLIESALDTCVSAFALPYTSFQSSIDSNVAKYIGISIVNAGYLAEPEPLKPNAENYKLPKNIDIFSSNVFVANDRNPQEETFKSTLDAALKKIAAGADAHVTLGIHSWQDNAGLERLGGYIDKYKSDDYWYCNESEYAAYRTQFLKSKIEKSSVKDGVAEFVLTRPAATNLGDDIPLEIEFSAPVKNIAVNGVEQKGVANTKIAAIPHEASKMSPRKIDHIENLDSANNVKQSRKFEGISGAMVYEKSSNSVAVVIKNDSQSKIENLAVTFRLPPCFKNSNQTFKLEDVDVGKGANASHFLAANRYEKAFKEGDTLFIAQCDFTIKGVPSRIYMTCVKKNPPRKADNPRDCTVYTNAFSDTLISREEIANMSIAGTPLTSIGGNKWQKSSSKRLRDFLLQYNGYGPAAKFPEGNFRALYCVEVVADADGEYTLVCTASSTDAIYLNGKMLAQVADSTPVKLSKGSNRVILELGKKALKKRPPALMMLDGKRMLPCARAAIDGQ